MISVTFPQDRNLLHAITISKRDRQTTCGTIVRIGLFQMVMCIPLICISDRRELVQIYQQEHMQQMTRVIFCKLLYGGFILGESESV